MGRTIHGSPFTMRKITTYGRLRSLDVRAPKSLMVFTPVRHDKNSAGAFAWASTLGTLLVRLDLRSLTCWCGMFVRGGRVHPEDFMPDESIHNEYILSTYCIWILDYVIRYWPFSSIQYCTQQSKHDRSMHTTPLKKGLGLGSGAATLYTYSKAPNGVHSLSSSTDTITQTHTGGTNFCYIWQGNTKKLQNQPLLLHNITRNYSFTDRRSNNIL